MATSAYRKYKIVERWPCPFHVAEFNQKTSPVYLPIEGKGDEIEISVISSSKDAFAVLGEQLVLQKPLDRDVSSSRSS